MIEILGPVAFMLLAFFLWGLSTYLWHEGKRLAAIVVFVICGYAIWLGQPAPKVIAIPVPVPELKEPADPFHVPGPKLQAQVW
jgi:hypothetical protein